MQSKNAGYRTIKTFHSAPTLQTQVLNFGCQSAALIAPVTTIIDNESFLALVTGRVAHTPKLVSGIETTIGSVAKAVCSAYALLALAHATG